MCLPTDALRGSETGLRPKPKRRTIAKGSRRRWLRDSSKMVSGKLGAVQWNESDDAAIGAAAGNMESMVTDWFGTDAGSLRVVHHGCENPGKLDLTAAAFDAETRHRTAASVNKGVSFPDSACAHRGPHSQPPPLSRPGAFLPFPDLRHAFLTVPSNPPFEARSTPYARRPSNRYPDAGCRHRRRQGHRRSRKIGRPRLACGRTVDGPRLEGCSPLVNAGLLTTGVLTALALCNAL